MTTHTVLFVDDEPNILKSLRRLFVDEDYDVLLAGSGLEALALLDKGLRPAVIISDQRMPQMSGAEFLAKAKQQLPESIRIVLTGYADIDSAVDAINRGGIYRYILKPWNDDDLKITVREAVKRFDLEQHNRELAAEIISKNKELAILNTSLEKKVDERTSELREALTRNQQLTSILQQKVKELEGRDSIQQHLLTIHPLEETLLLVLQVIGDIIGVDAAAVYLGENCLPETMKAFLSPLAKGRMLWDDAWPLLGVEIARIGNGQEPCQAVAQLEDCFDRPQNNVVLATVPLKKGATLFGYIVAGRWQHPVPFTEEAVQVIDQIGGLTSIAINDAQLQERLPEFEKSIDAILNFHS